VPLGEHAERWRWSGCHERRTAASPAYPPAATSGLPPGEVVRARRLRTPREWLVELKDVSLKVVRGRMASRALSHQFPENSS
jgi:hypothetical protein